MIALASPSMIRSGKRFGGWIDRVDRVGQVGQVGRVGRVGQVGQVERVGGGDAANSGDRASQLVVAFWSSCANARPPRLSDRRSDASVRRADDLLANFAVEVRIETAGVRKDP